METALRKKRGEIELLEKGGANEDDILAAKAKCHALSIEYAEFSKAMNLPQQRERISVDGRKGVDVSFGKQAANDEKPVAKSGESGIIQSGALTHKNDPDFKRRNAFAKSYYRELLGRKREIEISSVARNTDFSEEEIDLVFSHIFELEHLFEDGTIHKFFPDYDMAQSWFRLREGKTIYEHDLILLHHELEEAKIMGKSTDIAYESVHRKVEEKFNYSRALKKFLKENNLE